ESLSVSLELESQNTIVSIADHNDFPCGPMLSPVLYPKIENIMQVNIRKQRRDQRTLRSPHFRLRPCAILRYSCPQPLLDQAKYPSIIHSCEMVPKKSRMSASSTQLTFFLMTPTHNASSAACWLRPGRNPYENPRKSSSKI